MKRILSLVILSFLLFNYTQAQEQLSTANWKAHFAYLNFVDIAVSDENVYVAALNSVFAHNVATNTNIEYTTVDGLSGEDISVIYYAEEQSLIVIGYQNGLVEIINEISGKVTSLVDVSNQSGFPADSLKINNFFQDGSLLYIATGFGIVQYNLDTGFFGDTFLISDSPAIVSDVIAVGVIGDTILASIVDRGVYSGDKNNVNLITASNWTNIQPDVFVDIQILEDKLVAHKNTTDVYSYNGIDFSAVYVNSSEIIDFQVTPSDGLTLTYATGSINLNANFIENINIARDEANDLILGASLSVFVNDELYFSNTDKGFFRTNSLSFDDVISVSPDGPQLNNANSIDVYNGDVWLTFGEVSSSFLVGSVTRTGVSRRFDNKWVNFSFEDVLEAADITNVIIDRNRENHAYLSSFFGGLLEYSDGEFTLYNSENSNIEDDVSQETFPDFSLVFIDKVFSSTIDVNGDVWILNNRTKNPIKKFSNSGEGVVIDFSPIVNLDSSDVSDFNLNFWEIVIDDNFNIYAGSNTEGLIAYNSSSSLITSVEGNDKNIPTIGVTNVTLDKSGELWLGTFSGVRKFSNPNAIFNSTNISAESIIFLDDGIPQELLFEQSITDIKVDASNNKWIGTADGGVFYVSPDGQETIYNFTAENSPLPSNVINDIAVDDSTGAVFFATNKGLIEFNSNVIIASEDLTSLKVFPNPVRPEYENPTVTIQGLTAGANVKITDIEGNLVYETQNESFESGGSGSVLWDTKSFSGKNVSSGVYLILITDAEGVGTSIEKLLIVR